MQDKSTIMSLIKRNIRKTGYYIILMLAFLFASCGFFRAPGKDKCDKILSKSQMTDILIDIYMLEAFIREYQQIEPKAKDSAFYFYEALFKRHSVERHVFEEALDCYLLDRRDMDTIHEEMLNRLSLIESEAGIKQEDE